VNSLWTRWPPPSVGLTDPGGVSPRIMPASTTPMPPGTGETPPSMEASVRTTNSVARPRWSPKAWRAAPRARATKIWARALPPKISIRFARRAARIEGGPDLRGLGRSSGRQPDASAAPPAAGRWPHPRPHGDHDQPHQVSVLSPDEFDGDSKCIWPMARGSAMRNSAPFTIQLAVLTSTPSSPPPVGVSPSCWKNRTLVARSHRPSGQRHEGVGQLQGHGPAVGKGARHRAHRGGGDGR